LFSGILLSHELHISDAEYLQRFELLPGRLVCAERLSCWFVLQFIWAGQCDWALLGGILLSGVLQLGNPKSLSTWILLSWRQWKHDHLLIWQLLPIYWYVCSNAVYRRFVLFHHWFGQRHWSVYQRLLLSKRLVNCDCIYLHAWKLLSCRILESDRMSDRRILSHHKSVFFIIVYWWNILQFNWALDPIWQLLGWILLPHRIEQFISDHLRRKQLLPRRQLGCDELHCRLVLQRDWFVSGGWIVSAWVLLPAGLYESEAAVV
jgi:hypothetical protein